MVLKKWRHTILVSCILFRCGLCTGAEVVYTYDDLNRLVKADYGNGVYIEYFYDDTGNRTQKICAGAAVIPGDTDAGTEADLKDVIPDLRISSGEKPSGSYRDGK